MPTRNQGEEAHGCWGSLFRTGPSSCKLSDSAGLAPKAPGAYKAQEQGEGVCLFQCQACFPQVSTLPSLEHKQQGAATVEVPPRASGTPGRALEGGWSVRLTADLLSRGGVWREEISHQGVAWEGCCLPGAPWTLCVQPPMPWAASPLPRPCAMLPCPGARGLQTESSTNRAKLNLCLSCCSWVLCPNDQKVLRHRETTRRLALLIK